MMSEQSVKKSSLTAEELVEQYGDYLFRFAKYRVKRREVAEELVQDTLLAAWKGFDKFEGKSSLKTWLVTILKNKIMDFYRKSARQPEVIASDLHEEEGGAFENLFNRLGVWRTFLDEWKVTPESLVEQKGFIVQLSQCLEQLPERARRVITRRAIEDVPTEDVCAEMDISENNLWVILYRARMQLRNCIDGNWFRAA